MEILVCVKRVPDTAENEIEVNRDGSDIERDDLVYSVNEWDNYAVEEAIRIRDKVGGSVTVVTVGDEDAEEVLRREMAMGAEVNGQLVRVEGEAPRGSAFAAVARRTSRRGCARLCRRDGAHRPRGRSVRGRMNPAPRRRDGPT